MGDKLDRSPWISNSDSLEACNSDSAGDSEIENIIFKLHLPTRNWTLAFPFKELRGTKLVKKRKNVAKKFLK